MLSLYQNGGIIAELRGRLVGDGSEQGGHPAGRRPSCLVSGSNDVSRLRRDHRTIPRPSGPKALFPWCISAGTGRLRRTRVLGPDDDITLFEYVKRNNPPETGPRSWASSSVHPRVLRV